MCHEELHMSTLRQGQPLRLIAACTLVAWLSACTSPRHYSPDSPRLSGRESGEAVILLQDETQLNAVGVHVKGDSLFAYHRDEDTRSDEPQIRLARDEVSRVILREPDTTETVLLGLGVAGLAGVALVGYLLILIASDPDW